MQQKNVYMLLNSVNWLYQDIVVGSSVAYSTRAIIRSLCYVYSPSTEE